MADPTPKSGEEKQATDAAAQAPAARSKYLALLLAYKWPLVGGLAALVAIAIGAYGYMARMKRPEPAALLARAIECLKERDNPEASSEARKIASELDALHYRDSNFLGAVPYILGITDFRKAQKQNDRERVESL